ncbi:hypothetical protein BZG35_09370 [Brevundimonas sp. LM2]|nr:DUF4160 domain-containing protein [Brevundimonas sp. LM2]AQR63453.1 hypothetical protein BZG35_09370 [Brevundimonas sp. LM2]
MPTLLRSGPYRLYFYSSEPNEPPHVHIDRDDRSAKVWLHDVSVASNIGFSARELNVIQSLVREHRAMLRKGWHDFFGTQ